MFVKHTFVRSKGASPAAVAKARATARAAVRYYQHRPLGPEEPERGFFGPDGGLAREEVNRLLDEHQAGGYLVHRLILSPADDEQPEDLRALTRETLRRLAAEKGQALHWAAVEHRHTAHPHVHVVIAGAGEREGVVRGVRVDLPDIGRIKADARDYCREAGRERDGWARALDAAAREDAADRAPARERAVREVDRDDWSP